MATRGRCALGSEGAASITGDARARGGDSMRVVLTYPASAGSEVRVSGARGSDRSAQRVMLEGREEASDERRSRLRWASNSRFF